MTAPETVGFVGLTHLGVVSAAAAAAHGARVVAFGDDQETAAALADGRPPVFEPGLDQLLAEHGARLLFTADATELRTCDMVYVSVDVPTDHQGRSDLAPIREALAIALAATEEIPVIVLSQVPPGFTREMAETDSRILYQVETLVFGDAVARAIGPERFVIGTGDGMPPPDVVGRFLARFGCPVLSMRFESAELCKIAINVLLASVVTATNTMAGVSEGVGADWSEIVPALRLDRRIGPHAYLAPGLGLAGGNIERDLDTVRMLAERVGSGSHLVRALGRDSVARRGWVLRHLAPALAPDASIAILGLAYKPGTASIKNSLGIELVDTLGSLDVRSHDPVVLGQHHRVDLLDAVRGADAIAIATAWDDYRALDPRELAASMRGRLAVDPYGVLDAAACQRAGLDHHVLGRSPT